MKKLLIAVSIFTLGIVSAQKTSGKVVVSNSGEEIGRYIKENSTKYYISSQDEWWVPKKGNKVITYSAANGQGIIIPSSGIINVRKEPKLSSEIITKIIANDPMTFQCLGYKNGWFKTNIDGKIGYVKAENFSWDSINTL